MQSPLGTARLVVRPVEAGDAEALFLRRNDPAVATAQGWTLPYARERAEQLIADAAAQPGPQDGRWWMLTVTLAATGEVLGDLVVHPTNGCRTATVGYSFAHAAWGHGYAVEALEAFVAWLFDTLPVTRLEGRLHPNNRASAQVLERTGFRFEGHTRLSYWLEDDNSDDWIYGLTRADWAAWRDRPRSAPRDVGLVPITPERRRDVTRLVTHHSQQAFVAPVLDSLADALLPEVVDGAPLEPWFRAIEADGVLVGFVMLAAPTPAHVEPYLWRLLVDRMHQRRGIGARTLALAQEQCRVWGADALRVSWEEGRGSPLPFYLAHGFQPTGRVLEGETEARLVLG